MQIQAGWAKGLMLKVPKGDATRPTAAKVRAAAINRLAPYLQGGSFLDLCAGSGAMGIEAVSRGASGAVFIEAGAPALSCLRQNIAEAQRRAKAQSLGPPPLLVGGGALPQALGLAVVAQLAPYSAVFFDPPYKQAVALALAIFHRLAAVTTADAVVAVETAATDGPALLAAAPRPWLLLKQASYGDTMLTTFMKEAEDER